jgi:response regulator RpfG family c-di-GMP phosphodiesterase
MLLQKLKVLVVDDEPAIRDIVSDVLAPDRYVVRTAENGDEALRLLSADKYDVVLTDIEMPKMSGLQLLDRLRGLKHVPLAVVMTGYATVDNAIDAMRMGAYDYLEKPFKLDDIFRVLGRASEKLHLERENLQLKQAVSLYHVSEAMSLSLPIDTVLDIITDAVLQEVALDITAMYVGDDERSVVLRKRKSRVPHLTDQVLAALSWEAMHERFTDDKPILANGEDARAFFVADTEAEGLLAIPLRARNKIIGALVGISVTPGQYFHAGEHRLLSILASRTAAAVDNANLYNDLQSALTSTLDGLVSALEAKDTYTAGHSFRVARWAEIVAVLTKLSADEVGQVHRAAKLHDIGKIGMNEAALTKPGKLTPDEVDMFRTHPVVGEKILSNFKLFEPIVGWVKSHHERFDGEGYPDRLAGEKIPFGARILCLADSFEVMSTDRAYRRRLPRDIALAELRRCMGTHFDPGLTQSFVRYLEQFPTFREALLNADIPSKDRFDEATFSVEVLS